MPAMTTRFLAAVLFALAAGKLYGAPIALLQNGALPSGDPTALVAAFVDADANGLQTSSEYWPLVRRFAVWEDGPGWDTVTIVTAATVHAAQLRGRRATVRVQYAVFGTLHDDGDYNPVLKSARNRMQNITYRLIKQQGGWKIVAPQDGPRVVITQLLDDRYVEYCRQRDCATNRVIQALRAERDRHPFAVVMAR
jgi:hypothetical protein